MLDRVSGWTGWWLTSEQRAGLNAYVVWLCTEAVAAGGIGPNETARVWERHVADSLVFAAGWRQRRPPVTVVDLGSGVGLPGLPLAILWPETTVLLVDRAQKRIDLLARVIRMLKLSNAQVVHGDASQSGDTRAEMVVARGAGRAEAVLGWARGWVAANGIIVVGGSHVRRPDPVDGEEIVPVPPEILDRPVWLRMMAPS